MHCQPGDEKSCFSERTCLSGFFCNIMNRVDTIVLTQIMMHQLICAMSSLVKDLMFAFLRSAPISVAYTTLDVLHVCILLIEFMLSVPVSL